MMDAFERWWAWAKKPRDDQSTVPSWLHEAVMNLPLEARRDRARLNAAAKEAEERDEA